MKFAPHSELEGQHAFLSASVHHWLNYDPDKLRETYLNRLEAAKGTRLHVFAKDAIELGIKLPAEQKTLNLFVNDAIGFKMTPEVILYYSRNCFGTTDAISFRQNKLRIHDLKNGKTKASFNQLLIYAALFCLEYEVKPSSIEMELRIYKDDDIQVLVPELDDVVHIMDKIVSFDKYIEEVRVGVWS